MFGVWGVEEKGRRKTFTRFGDLGHLTYGIMEKHLHANKNQQVIVLNDVLNIKTSNKLFGHV
jgi:hypothetical protein